MVKSKRRSMAKKLLFSAKIWCHIKLFSLLCDEHYIAWRGYLFPAWRSPPAASPAGILPRWGSLLYTSLQALLFYTV